MGKCCVRPEDSRDEEVISLIFSTMAMNRQRGETLLNDLLQEFDNQFGSGNEKSKINSFINKLIYANQVQENEFCEEQTNYLLCFFNDRDRLVKTLGIFIIFNSFFESIKDKQSLLIAHLLQNYGKTEDGLLEFLGDIVEMNTSFILKSFKIKLENIKYYESALWSQNNVEKLKLRLFSDYLTLKNSTKEIEPYDVIPKTIKSNRSKSKPKERASNKNDQSFTSNKSSTSNPGKRKSFEEDKENLMKKFLLDNYYRLEGRGLREELLKTLY